MQVQCSKCGGDTDTGFRCVKCGHSMQPHTGGTQPTAHNSAMDAIARITEVLDDASHCAETKVTLINIIIGQQHQ